MSSTNPTKMCVLLPNGECISPYRCAHGPALSIGDFRVLVTAEVEPLMRSQELLKKFLLAAQGKNPVLTPDDLQQARDLTLHIP